MPEVSPIIQSQILALQERFPGLGLHVRDDGYAVVAGMLGFNTSYGEYAIQDEYLVKIVIPSDYPDTLPRAFEIGGKIPKDFHMMTDRSLCLGSPLEMALKFSETPSLLGFVERLLIPYLFSYACWEKFKVMPFGERAHGSAGILQSYQDLFGTSDIVATMNLLRMLADDSYLGHTLCPCNTGKKLRNCHGPTLLNLMQHRTTKQFLLDHSDLLLHCHATDPTLNLFELESVSGKKMRMKIKRSKELAANPRTSASKKSAKPGC